MSECKECGAPIRDEELEDGMMNCPNCGATLPSDFDPTDTEIDEDIFGLAIDEAGDPDDDDDDFGDDDVDDDGYDRD